MLGNMLDKPHIPERPEQSSYPAMVQKIFNGLVSSKGRALEFKLRGRGFQSQRPLERFSGKYFSKSMHVCK